MKTATCHLRSVVAYSQSRAHGVPKEDREASDAYERRTWREKLHYGQSGEVFIPPMSFKNCLSEAAKYLSRQIPGKGKTTYTKHFEAGVLVTEPVMLGIQKDDVDGEWLFLPADGVRGSGKRVWKCFPVIPEWSATVEFAVFDDTVTKEVFTDHLAEAGRFIGIGRFRPRNNGYYGRFVIDKITWS